MVRRRVATLYLQRASGVRPVGKRRRWRVIGPRLVARSKHEGLIAAARPTSEHEGIRETKLSATAFALAYGDVWSWKLIPFPRRGGGGDFTIIVVNSPCARTARRYHFRQVLHSTAAVIRLPFSSFFCSPFHSHSFLAFHRSAIASQPTSVCICTADMRFRSVHKNNVRFKSTVQSLT